MGLLGKLLTGGVGLVGIMLLFVMFSSGALIGAEAAVNESVTPGEVHDNFESARSNVDRDLQQNLTAEEYKVAKRYVEFIWPAVESGMWFGYDHPVAALWIGRYSGAIVGTMAFFHILLAINDVNYFSPITHKFIPWPLNLVVRLL